MAKNEKGGSSMESFDNSKKNPRDMTSEEIIAIIANSKKNIVRAYVSGDLDKLNVASMDGYDSEFEFIGCDTFGVFFGNYDFISPVLKSEYVSSSKVEWIARNSAIPLSDISQFNARIEPGAVIREYVEIGKNAVVMMGAVINLGAIVGEGTMIDMNVVIGARAQIGKYCHIGAGSVIAGVVEPPNATPVVIEDRVVVGANAVVLEGVKVGEGSVIAAGAIVVDSVQPYTVVAGMPAKVIKKVDEKTVGKTQILEELRKLK